jgi:hypothetical protein
MNRIKQTLLMAATAFCLTISLDASAQEGLTMRSLRRMARGRTSPAQAAAALADVCPTVKNVTGNEFLYKSQISDHISKNDKRAAGPTFICNRLCPSFPASIFYSDGDLATRVGLYGRWKVTGKARAYCAAGGVPACSNSTLNRNARARGRDGFLYIKINSSTCYRVKPLGRTGSPT